MARTSTMAVTAPLRRRSVLFVGDAERVLVVRCTGTGPYTLTVRRLTWFDRLWLRVAGPLRRLRRTVRAWRLSRCDVWWCWRREAVVDVEWCGWCRVHAVGKTARHET